METISESDIPAREAHLLDYWRVIVQRRWAVFLTTAFVAICATIWTFTMRPVYRATVQLQIERSTPKVLPFQELMAGVHEAGLDFYQTQYRIIQSRTIARRVIEALDLRRNADFIGAAAEAVPGARSTDAGAPQEDDRLVDLFASRLSVDPVRNSQLVSVSFESPSAELSAMAANAVADAYVSFTLDTSFATSESASHSMAQQIRDLQDDIARSQRALHEYAREKQLIFLGGQQTSAEQDLTNLRAEYGRARNDRIAKEAAYRTLREADPASIPSVATNGLIQELRSSYVTLQKEYAEKSEKFKPGWPALVELEARKDAARRQLEEQIVQIAARLIDSAAVEYRQAVHKERSLKEALESLTAQVQELDLASITYYSMKADLESKKKNLGELLEREGQTGISARLSDKATSNIRIIDRAEVPRYAFKPRRKLTMAMGVLAGLILGTALAFFLEYIDNTLKTPADVEKHLRVATLAVIPCVSEGHAERYVSERSGADEPALDLVRDGVSGSGLASACRELGASIIPAVTGALSRRSMGKRAGADGGGPGLDLITHLAPRSALAEAYKELRTSILLSSADAAPASLLITSSHPAEGKTSTSINLAIALAQIGRRVLLVDTDLRKPRIHKALGVSNARGISTYLSGNAELEDLVLQSGISDLWVLPAGPSPPNPSDLLESSRLRELLKMTEPPERFAHVIFDSPPLLSFADASILSTRVEAVILVIWGGKTNREVAIRGREKLVQGRARLIGVILNNVSRESQDYYYYRYKYYKYYTQRVEDTLAQASGTRHRRPNIRVRLKRTG